MSGKRKPKHWLFDMYTAPYRRIHKAKGRTMGLKKIEKAEWKGDKFSLRFDEEGDAVIEVGDESFYLNKGVRREVEELEEVLAKVREEFGLKREGELSADCSEDMRLVLAVKRWLSHHMMSGQLGPHYNVPTYGRRLRLPEEAVAMLRSSEVLP